MFNSCSKGLTLIEVLLSLILMATVFFFAIPLSSALYQKNQIEVRVHDIEGAIRLAKTEALMRGESLMLMPCSGEHWSSGIRVVAYHTDHEPEVIYEWPWPASRVVVHWNGFQSKQYLLFSADVSHHAANGYFLITSPQSHSVKLVINRLGRVRHEI